MNPWSLAIWALLPPMAVAAAAALRGTVAARLVAVQLATAVAILMLVLMSFAFDQDSYLDLALAVAFVNLPGALVMALLVERWL